MGSSVWFTIKRLHARIRILIVIKPKDSGNCAGEELDHIVKDFWHAHIAYLKGCFALNSALCRVLNSYFDLLHLNYCQPQYELLFFELII